MAKQWYVLQVRTNYENKVQLGIEKGASKAFPAVVGDVKIPVEDVVEVKNGKRRTVKKKFFPGYVLIEMDLPETKLEVKQVLSEIRRTNGVIGFTSADRDERPRPLSAEETKQILQRMGEIRGPEQVLARADFNQGDRIKIIEGAFKDFEGTVEEVMDDKARMKVHVEIFGRKTLVEVGFLQIERM